MAWQVQLFPSKLKARFRLPLIIRIAYGCIYDTINLHYVAGKWSEPMVVDIRIFNGPVLLPDTSILENIFGSKNIQHIVSNGFCSDTVSETINLDNLLTAAFKAPEEVCPKNRSHSITEVPGKSFPIYGISATALRAQNKTRQVTVS